MWILIKRVGPGLARRNFKGVFIGKRWRKSMNSLWALNKTKRKLEALILLKSLLFLNEMHYLSWFRRYVLVLFKFLVWFLGHRSQRLQWPIVITRCPASVVRRPSSVVRLSSVRLFTFSTSSPEPLDGFWWNLVWMKYSRSLTSVVVFLARSVQGRIQGGAKIGHGVPFFKKLLLQTGRLQEQTECIAVI